MNKIMCFGKRGGRCQIKAVYRVYKSGEVNRYLCGFHARRYFEANRVEAFKAEIIGKKRALPYIIISIRNAGIYYTKEEKDKLKRQW